MRIVTAGSKYLDIDSYAGCVAYAELLQTQGQPALAASSGVLNQSVPDVVREWGVAIEADYTPSSEDTFTIIDTSNPDYLDSFVVIERVAEIIDHHPGFEDFWQRRIGTNADIQRVGAACTQVFERWEKVGLVPQMSKISARLLMCGILDNTLNFGADITTTRDHHAYKVLSARADLPTDWPAQYFAACQQGIMADLGQAVADDTKIMDCRTFPHTMAVGQLALWDAAQAAKDAHELFGQKLRSVQPYWFMNLIGISDNHSYFVSDVPEVQTWLSSLLEIEFVGTMAMSPRPWLRKEIFKADIDRAVLATQAP